MPSESNVTISVSGLHYYEQEQRDPEKARHTYFNQRCQKLAVSGVRTKWKASVPFFL